MSDWTIRSSRAHGSTTNPRGKKCGREGRAILVRPAGKGSTLHHIMANTDNLCKSCGETLCLPHDILLCSKCGASVSVFSLLNCRQQQMHTDSARAIIMPNHMHFSKFHGKPSIARKDYNLIGLALSFEPVMTPTHIGLPTMEGLI